MGLGQPCLGCWKNVPRAWMGLAGNVWGAGEAPGGNTRRRAAAESWIPGSGEGFGMLVCL